eukprot:scaffold4058_cov257-Pinguiococcus_pyrenoidosus.AAC.11
MEMDELFDRHLDEREYCRTDHEHEDDAPSPSPRRIDDDIEDELDLESEEVEDVRGFLLSDGGGTFMSSHMGSVSLNSYGGIGMDHGIAGFSLSPHAGIGLGVNPVPVSRPAATTGALSSALADSTVDGTTDSRPTVLGAADGQPFGGAPSGGAHEAGEAGSVLDTMGLRMPERPPEGSRTVGLDSFKLLKVIGKGSFGKVFLVREKQGQQIYAMKVLRKANIIRRNQVEHTKTERSVLGYIRHPFIVGLNMAFQTRDKLFFVLDYCAGGELFFHLGKLGRFQEPRAKFYAAEIACALEHIHSLNIIYRDLKPENVLLNAMGHVQLTDFGLSKEGIDSNVRGATSFCGTPEYLAPEILNRQGHGRAVDWWSLGALLYEMLTGLPPFYCRDREQLFEKIRRAELKFPRYLSGRAKHLLEGLLTRNPHKRLGSGPSDANEIKEHPMFADLDFGALLQLKISPPWQPQVVGSLDTSLFDREFTSMPIFSPDGAPRDIRLDGMEDHDAVFEGFTYTGESGVHFQSPKQSPTLSPSGTAPVAPFAPAALTPSALNPARGDQVGSASGAVVRGFRS